MSVSYWEGGENKKEYAIIEIVRYPIINNVFVFVEERESYYLDKVDDWIKSYEEYVK